MEVKQKREPMKISFFDFDGTLFKSPMPSEEVCKNIPHAHWTVVGFTHDWQTEKYAYTERFRLVSTLGDAFPTLR